MFPPSSQSQPEANDRIGDSAPPGNASQKAATKDMPSQRSTDSALRSAGITAVGIKRGPKEGKATVPPQEPAEAESLQVTRGEIAESTTFLAVKTCLKDFLKKLLETAKEEGLFIVLQGFEDDDFEDEDGDGKSSSSMAFATVETNFTGFLGDLMDRAKIAGLLDGFDEKVNEASKSSGKQTSVSSSQDIPSTKDATASLVTPPSTPPHGSDNASAQVSGSPCNMLSPKKPMSRNLSPIPPNPVNALCTLLAQTVLDRSEQSMAKRITITKAYKTSMAKTVKCHFDAVSQVTAATNNRTVGAVKRKREELGFKPEEIMKHGALNTAENSIKSTLEGDAHRIFDEMYFTDCPHDVYELIKPALLLATKFLKTPQCLQHFQTVLKGRREYCYYTSSHMNEDRWRIREDVPITSASLVDLKRHIDALAGTITWQFLDAGARPGKPDCYFAMTNIIPHNHNRVDLLDHTTHTSTSVRSIDRPHTVISIHPDYYIEAKRLCRLRYPDTAQFLRYQVFLAVLIMHELAHVWEIACNPTVTPGTEVFLYDLLAAESGSAWERNMFGGRVIAISDRCDALFGLALTEWPNPELTDRSKSGQDELWSVPMTYIHSIMQQTFWDELSQRPIGDKTLLHIPKTGAKSIGLYSMTTAKYEDVLGDREMSAMELALREVEEDWEESPGLKRRRGTHMPQQMKKAHGGGRVCEIVSDSK